MTTPGDGAKSQTETQPTITVVDRKIITAQYYHVKLGNVNVCVSFLFHGEKSSWGSYWNHWKAHHHIPNGCPLKLFWYLRPFFSYKLIGLYQKDLVGVVTSALRPYDTIKYLHLLKIDVVQTCPLKEAKNENSSQPRVRPGVSGWFCDTHTQYEGITLLDHR